MKIFGLFFGPEVTALEVVLSSDPESLDELNIAWRLFEPLTS